jgi:hypothetical protein
MSLKNSRTLDGEECVALEATQNIGLPKPGAYWSELSRQVRSQESAQSRSACNKPETPPSSFR